MKSTTKHINQPKRLADRIKKARRRTNKHTEKVEQRRRDQLALETMSDGRREKKMEDARLLAADVRSKL